MTNRIALNLGLIIAGAIVWDIYRNDGAALVFLARRGLDLIAYLAFWRYFPPEPPLGTVDLSPKIAMLAPTAYSKLPPRAQANGAQAKECSYVSQSRN